MERQPEDYHAQWIKEQQEVVRELGLALQGGHIHDQQLEEIVEKAASRYQHYFRPSASSSHRSFSMHSSPVLSPLEQAFTWFGDMRPSLSFQLIYCLTGHHIEAELEELLELGGHTDEQRPASLASLSALQLEQLSDLQTLTMKEEDTIEREMAKLQENTADHPRLFKVLSSGSSSSAPSEGDIVQESMESLVRKKLEFLEEICMQADSLRLSTLRRVLDVLYNPFLKAQYLIAAAKLQVALWHLGHSKTASVSRQC